jgi:hypothetical protein
LRASYGQPDFDSIAKRAEAMRFGGTRTAGGPLLFGIHDPLLKGRYAQYCVRVGSMSTNFCVLDRIINRRVSR